ncbi:hypothetical protein [Acuticoccus sp. I52.16.1]|uniref:hypothetical protein n=1 Tax=Acuticoccus sp. I52.16.1 TaxID=2928472 RepID=UPI001FD3F8E7|nr:hypothetical protein [Acuticoccus sp. I52.16.1]UOM33315.1 hypothetical protein MRB58_15785 [Acuticoccus sp. I52.16.1]
MRFICHDPLNVACRVMDMARRAGIEIDSLSLTRREDGTSIFDCAILDPGADQARLFEARVAVLLDQIPEGVDG